MLTKIPIYLICWHGTIIQENDDSYGPQIVKESKAFLSHSDAVHYCNTLNEEAERHGWDLEKAGYMIKIMDADIPDNYNYPLNRY